MNVTLIRIDAQDASGGAVPIRLSSHDIPEACHLGGEEWEPALVALPDFALDFFGGGFAGQVTAPRTGFSVATSGLAAFGAVAANRARCADARVRIWVGDITSTATADLGPLTLRFDGRITGEPDIDDATRIARFDAAVKDSWADKPLLALFAGTGGIEGPADLTGQPKPLVLGNVRFARGVLIDNVDNVWMVSHGAVEGISAAYDRLASLGVSSGDHADLAALLEASIPNGSWATCKAQGLVRLGAPPDGRVSFDVQGSNVGTGGYVRKPGAMIRRIADLAGGTVNAASLTALDTARPYNLQLQLSEQTTAREVIARIADSVAAVAGVSLTGELFAQALGIGTASQTINADGSSALAVLSVEELAKAAPSWRLATEAELTFEVHTADEAAFGYRWQGEYSATRVYRIDDVVSGPGGSSWVYVNAIPAAGQALPVLPATSNTHWQIFGSAVDPEAIGVEPGATRNTGALNEDGLDAIDAGGPLFVGQLPGGRIDGDFAGNIIADPIFGEGWVYSNAAYSPGASGSNLYDRHRAVFLGEGVIWFLGATFPALERGAVQAGETYFFSAWFFRSSSATGNITARVQTYDATGANVGVQDIPGVITSSGPNDTWYRMQGQWTCPAGVAYVRPLVGNNTGGTTSTIFVALPYFGRHQPGADVTATAQRTIEPQYPVIEIKQGEAGHTGNRTVTHAAKRGTATLTGGTWSLPSSNLGSGSASINSSTGTVTLSGIVQSGAYSVRYTHSDGLATDLAVNVTYVPTPPGGVVSAKTASASSNTGVGNTNAWSQVISLSVTSAPAGRLFFNNFGFTGGNRIEPSTGTGTCEHQARLLINSTVVATAPAQSTVSGGVIGFADFSALFQEAHAVPAGTVTVSVELQRTSGTGTISTMFNSLDVTIIAS